MNKEMKAWFVEALRASKEAGDAILEVYRTDFDVDIKDDKSPLTEADRKSHDVICERLASVSAIPIMTEEGRSVPYEERKEWGSYWLVDPLDGTKEFVNRNGEFTVNIALIENRRPCWGVVFMPVTNTMYWGGGAFGSKKCIIPQNADPDYEQLFESGDHIQAVLPGNVITVVASRSHMNEETKAFVEKLKEHYSGVELVSSGSSLKLCRVAEGAAHLYPRLGPTMEWDTAAAQAIVEGAGGEVLKFETLSSLAYNKEDLLNPHFLVKPVNLVI